MVKMFPKDRPICYGSLKVTVLGELCDCEFLKGCSDKYTEDNYEAFKEIIEDSRKRSMITIMTTPHRSQGRFCPKPICPRNGLNWSETNW